MNLERSIGLAAALLTTIAFVPQVIRSWRTRDTRGISLPMYSVFTVGIGLWLVYGLMLHDLPITLANGVTLALALAVLVLKLRHG
ncbi:MAG TPA: SemiSWEET transporter [Gammaproteobacteria bacterium]|nr:SemiSWEET transporter [Gammaproteobacteria bacterium]